MYTRFKYRATLFGIVLLTILMNPFMHPQSVGAQTSTHAWAQVSGIPSNVTLEDVFFANSTTAWAVGWEQTTSGQKLGVVYRFSWQNDRWEVGYDASTDTPLQSISVIALENIWVVGEAGRIMHKDTQGWQNVEQFQSQVNFTTIQMFGNGEEGWVGGFRPGARGYDPFPIMLHYHDGRWDQDTSVGVLEVIRDLHFAPGSGWAVGNQRIWHYQDSQWSEETPPEPCSDGTSCTFSLTEARALSADEAWAVGTRQGFCAICRPSIYAMHRTNGTWHVALPETPIANMPPQVSQPATSSLAGIYFTDEQNGLVVGDISGEGTSASNPQPIIMRYRAGTWAYEQLPAASGSLHAVSMTEGDRAIAVGTNGLVLSYGYAQPQQSASGAHLTAPIADPRDPNVTYFAQVGHTLRGRFRDYWQRNGRLEQFGYPLTEEFAEGGSTVQYFERARFEAHPENQLPYDVLLGLLGHTITEDRQWEQPFQPVDDANGPRRYFPETRHHMALEFEPYWEGHGGLPIYGYPISEPFMEVNAADGKSYLVQYFERNRFEYHPELPGPYTVSLGLLGREVLQGRGWLPK